MPLTDRERVAHLLRRFGLGASEAEINFYGAGGWQNAVDRLLNYEKVQEPYAMTLKAMHEALYAGRGKVPNLKMSDLQTWWIVRMIYSQRPLQEKLTLFWHDHFATSGDKVTSVDVMYRQNEILRAGATGKFGTLINQVSKDPAMIFWLDNEYNVKEHPNENFAREVMELFTLGIGNYSEKDIQEAARAFSGWTLKSRGGRGKSTFAKNGKLAGNQVFSEGEAEHDSGMKQILGQKGPFDGDDILSILCSMPRTAWYITWKMWEWFAYENPSKAVIDPIADRFRQSDLNIKVLLRDIMMSEEFYSERAHRQVYKNPIDFTVATLRQIGYGQNDLKTATMAATAARVASRGMGMDVIFPPDVSGWTGGEAWVTSATIVERIKWAGYLFGESAMNGKRIRVELTVQAYDLFAKDPSPTGVVRTLASIFDAPLPPAKMQIVVKAVDAIAKGRVTPANANAAAVAAAKLMFGSPEFQFA